MNYSSPSANPSHKGSVLVVSLVLISVLSAVIMASMRRSTMDTQMAGGWSKKIRSFEVSETGMRLAARKVLNEYNNTKSISPLLNTIELGTSGGGQFGVLILDNDQVGGQDQDGDGNAATDADGVFRLLSTGEVGDHQQVIEAYFQVQSGGSDLPGSEGIGALGICANNAHISRASNISGQDYLLPGYPCSGAHCNGTPSGNPDAPGLSYNTGTVVNLSGGSPGGSPSINGGAGIDCTAWSNFMNTAVNSASSTFLASEGPFNAASVATDFGTDTDPRIVVVSGTSGETVKFNGNLFGNGILIVRNAHVVFTGTFTYAGLIIVEDEGGGIQLSGTSSLFGSVMVLNSNTSDSQVEVDIKSNPTRMRYSSEGLARASLALSSTGASNGSLTLLAWRLFPN